MKNKSFEYNSLSFLITTPLFLGIGFIKIIRDVGNDFWISLIIGILLGLIITQILKLLPKNNNKPLFILINFIILLIITSSLTRSISHLYLNKTPDYFIFIPFLLVMYYASTKKDDVIFKVANIILFINIFLFIFSSILLIPLFKIDNLMPLFGDSSILNIIYSGIDFALLSTIPLMLLSKHNKKIYTLSSLYIFLVFVLIIGTLGINVASIFNYPEYIILKRVSFFDFFDNIQNFIFLSWIFSSFTLGGLVCTNIENYSNKKTLLIILILTFIINTVFSNFQIFNFINNYIRYILISIVIIFLINKMLRKRT